MTLKKRDDFETPFPAEDADDAGNLLDAFEGILPLELIDEMEIETPSAGLSADQTASVHYDDEEENLIARLDLKIEPETVKKARLFAQGLLMGIAFADCTDSRNTSN